ncbi:MAG TPA: hypothetical protein PLX89_07655 [Verrucomicrobiota bacterium]|nr:hypothetical protein [Verrucomicrobiales bacterium]HRI12864.1 hypothetical protein [Verrucomicrobiota bacterium]
MKALSLTEVQHPAASEKFDLFKLTHAPREVGLAPNTIRSLFAKGLRRYHLGKLVLVSRSDLAEFIRNRGE